MDTGVNDVEGGAYGLSGADDVGIAEDGSGHALVLDCRRACEALRGEGINQKRVQPIAIPRRHVHAWRACSVLTISGLRISRGSGACPRALLGRLARCSGLRSIHGGGAMGSSCGGCLPASKILGFRRRVGICRVVAKHCVLGFKRGDALKQACAAVRSGRFCICCSTCCGCFLLALVLLLAPFRPRGDGLG